MNSQFKKGALELVVLSELLKKDEYGYELFKSISFNLDIAEGSLYPLLRRLVKYKFLSTYHVDSNKGPTRKYYRLTSKGKERLTLLKKEWEVFSLSMNNFVKIGGNL